MNSGDDHVQEPAQQDFPSRSRRHLARRRRRLVWAWVAACLLVFAGTTIWLGTRALSLNAEMGQIVSLVPELKSQIEKDDSTAALATVEQLKEHSASSRQLVSDPVWTAATAVPWLGPNFQAAREIAISADDVIQLGIGPLAQTYKTLDWKTLVSDGEGIDLQPLTAAAPELASASHAISASSRRLNGINESALIADLESPLVEFKQQLASAGKSLDAAADAARLAPEMMGGSSPRQYLLLIQNNAEVRATGGIPGALAVLTFSDGKMSLTDQNSAGGLGTVSPTVQVDAEQQQIYSSRLGKYMQDVNLTPDFPTAANTAQRMWEIKTGQKVDGVISIDPVALGYVLDATGPVTIDDPEVLKLARGGLPTELNSKNVVKTLLSDVYAKIEQPEKQDAYFAAVAKKIFSALSGGQGEAKGLIEGVTRGSQEGRILVWSGREEEQSVIATYVLGGSTSGPSVSPAEFGLYFNDGTGAKMDYYVKRTVQLIKECAKDGYEQTTVRVTSTNTAPMDAATSLPAYVTGDGNFGVPPGSVQTNLVAYGPAQANVETVKLGDEQTAFAPHIHGDRPVGVLALRLGPGESKTVDFTFGKIVQHTEPNLAVTPTVQDVRDVILDTTISPCEAGSKTSR